MKKYMIIVKKIYLFLILGSCATHKKSYKAETIFKSQFAGMIMFLILGLTLSVTLVFPYSEFEKLTIKYYGNLLLVLPILSILINSYILKNYNLEYYYITLKKLPRLSGKLKIYFNTLYFGIFIIFVIILMLLTAKFE